MSGSLWLFLAIAAQGALLAALATSRVWRATGVSIALGALTLMLLWYVTRGGSTRTEAWLVLTSLPLCAIGAFSWHKGLGKTAMALGVLLTLALLGAWVWAQRGVDPIAPTIVYSILVLIAMLAIFLIGGWLLMQTLIERTRKADAEMAMDENA